MSAFSAKLGWYANRLAAMSAAEIAHRLTEAGKRKIDRRFSSHLVPSLPDYGSLPCIPGLREKLAAWSLPAETKTDWKNAAERARSGHVFLLGQEWPTCDNVRRWYLDPITGKFWPHDAFCFDINYRHAKDIGDIKYVWEINRLQYLQPVAALVFCSKDKNLAHFCLTEVESWIDNNPPHKGVNWTSGIELALRVVSLAVITTLIGEHATPEQCKKIGATLLAHALWLERYPSKFSSANNHLTAEGLGLFVIGTLCPQFDGAERWKTYGWSVLCDATRTLILPDGGGAEQTPTYLAVVLEMLLLGYDIAKSSRTVVPDYFLSQLTLAGEFLRWLTDAAGSQPRIGDDDEACVLGLYQRDASYVSAILSCIAAIGNRPYLTPPNLKPHFRQALFGSAPNPTPAPIGTRAFDHTGLTVSRFHAQGREVLLAMDHGALGYLSIAAHGHADALAIWLHLDDQPVLVDAGTYLYHSGETWRSTFRGTKAHNTLVMEDTNSSTMSGHFNWSRKAEARVISRDLISSPWHIEAEHDGYKSPFGALHRRRLSITPDLGFSVEDRVTGKSPHTVEIGFLLHPDLTATIEGAEILVLKKNDVLLRLTHDGPLVPFLDKAGTPEGGWYSPHFGEKLPATRIAFKGRLAREQGFTVKFDVAPALRTILNG